VPGDCPPLRFELFDSCARYKFSSFIHGRRRKERKRGWEGNGREKRERSKVNPCTEQKFWQWALDVLASGLASK